MRQRAVSGSRSKWAGLLMAFVFVAAMIAVSVILLRRDTWRRDARTDDIGRRDTRTDVAPVPEPQGDEMTRITECFSAFRGEGSDRRPMSLRREPLLRWDDPAQDLTEAALWAWGGRGRPYALVTLERSADPGRGDDPGSWGFELISLVDGPLEVGGSNEVRARNAARAANSKPVLSGTIHWTPRRPGVDFRDVPDAPPPAPEAKARLLQMKDLLRRFAAVVRPGQPDELRLLPDPIDRYSDADAGQVDGAIFAFAMGTNPEAMVLLEAQGPTPDKASWRYAVAPATVAPFEVAIDGKRVFTAPYHSEAKNTPDGPYFTVRMPRLKP